jgi:hypothetical protein
MILKGISNGGSELEVDATTDKEFCTLSDDGAALVLRWQRLGRDPSWLVGCCWGRGLDLPQ